MKMHPSDSADSHCMAGQSTRGKVQCMSSLFWFLISPSWVHCWTWDGTTSLALPSGSQKLWAMKQRNLSSCLTVAPIWICWSLALPLQGASTHPHTHIRTSTCLSLFYMAKIKTPFSTWFVKFEILQSAVWLQWQTGREAYVKWKLVPFLLYNLSDSREQETPSAVGTPGPLQSIQVVGSRQCYAIFDLCWANVQSWTCTTAVGVC